MANLFSDFRVYRDNDLVSPRFKSSRLYVQTSKMLLYYVCRPCVAFNLLKDAENVYMHDFEPNVYIVHFSRERSRNKAGAGLRV